jgi:hypothetical protein
MSKLFPGAVAKIKRAETQIEDFNLKITRFFEASPYERFSEVNAQKTEEVWKHRLTANIPDEFPVLAGEILFNLRSALDQMACALAVLHSGTSEKTYFPFARDANEFEKELREKTKKLSPDAVSMIRAVKPYRGGNDLLWSLHDLNRRDKHIAILPVAVCGALGFFEVKVFTGDLIRIGPKLGRHMVRSATGVVAPDDAKRPIRREADGKTWVEFGMLPDARPDEQMDFLTVTPGAHFEADTQPAFNIAFGDIEVLKTEPVVAVLHQMRQLVDGIILTFDKRFG